MARNGFLVKKAPRGAWLAQSVECQTPAPVMTSRLVSPSSLSGSLPSAQSLLQTLRPFLSLPHLHSLSFSKINKTLKKKKKKERKKAQHWLQDHKHICHCQLTRALARAASLHDDGDPHPVGLLTGLEPSPAESSHLTPIC